MADVLCLHSKYEVEKFCRENPALHLYALGDLDGFFRPHTTWYALSERGHVRQIVLLYSGQALPTVLALAERHIGLMRDLLRWLLPVLPRRFYAHLTASVADVLEGDYRLKSHGRHHKMALTDRSRISTLDCSEAVALSSADTDELLALYEASYPGNWFVPRMLETGCYFGIRRGHALVSVAGVHVYSPAYKVAALGNIATRPEARGQGLATAVTGRLCQELLRNRIEHIGLNVRTDNCHAVSCYRRLGFEHIADYEEFTVEARI